MVAYQVQTMPRTIKSQGLESPGMWELVLRQLSNRVNASVVPDIVAIATAENKVMF